MRPSAAGKNLQELYSANGQFVFKTLKTISVSQHIYKIKASLLTYFKPVVLRSTTALCKWTAFI